MKILSFEVYDPSLPDRSKQFGDVTNGHLKSSEVDEVLSSFTQFSTVDGFHCSKISPSGCSVQGVSSMDRRNIIEILSKL